MDAWTWRGMYGSGQLATMKVVAKCCAGAAGPILLITSVRPFVPPTIQMTVTTPMGSGVCVGRCLLSLNALSYEGTRTMTYPMCLGLFPNPRLQG